jgi:hypothetical protein
MPGIVVLEDNWAQTERLPTTGGDATAPVDPDPLHRSRPGEAARSGTEPPMPTRLAHPWMRRVVIAPCRAWEGALAW